MAFDSDSDGMDDSYEELHACLNWKVNDRLDDPDHDTLTNAAERNRHTLPCVSDTDKDGCNDGREIGNNPAAGGQRNPLNFWDFHDVPTGSTLSRDRTITAADIWAVLGRFASTTYYGPGEADFGVDSDPLSTPHPLIAGPNRYNYHPAYDRNRDSAIYADDLFMVLGQFGHSCI